MSEEPRKIAELIVDVEKFMPPVAAAIKRHIKWPSAEFNDIYNRAYEAVYNAIKECAPKEKN